MYNVYSNYKQWMIGNRSEEFGWQINSGMTHIVLLIIEDLCAMLKQSWDVEPHSLFGNVLLHKLSEVTYCCAFFLWQPAFRYN